MTGRLGRVIFTGVIGLVFLAMALMSLALSPTARLLPLMVSVPGALLSLVALLQDIRSAAVPKDDATPQDMTELKAALWIFAFWMAILLFGFIIGAPLITAAYLFLGLRSGTLASIIAGMVCLAGTYGVFERLLHVPLFHGLLTPLLLRALT